MSLGVEICQLDKNHQAVFLALKEEVLDELECCAQKRLE